MCNRTISCCGSCAVILIDQNRSGSDYLGISFSTVIKQMLNHKLYSLNKALPYGEKSEDDHVTIVGKVLGKVSPLELPADDDIHLLEEVKAQEVREFKKKYGLL